MNAPRQMHVLNICSNPRRATKTSVQEHKWLGHHLPHHHFTPTDFNMLTAFVNHPVTPAVNHLPCWPAIVPCSQSEHRPPCCTPAWTPHPSHNAVGLPPTFLQPHSLYLSLSRFTTPAFMDSNRSITHCSLCTISPPPIPVSALIQLFLVFSLSDSV